MENQYLNQLDQMQDELKIIALYLCDDDKQRAKDLITKTNELARKYDPKKEFRIWVLTILKEVYFLQSIKRLQVRTQ